MAVERTIHCLGKGLSPRTRSYRLVRFFRAA